ncbi:phosphatase [Desulfogranum japonicum]|uniref:phosphatase n=1 Tax=Desulfogranum japonicum TaxID=231447 RepID=UPI00040D6C62|nr:phosphatase [Desulfogranum japonicum]
MHIQVDSHTHTVASGHAYSTLAENINVAAARGIKLLAHTDHGPAMPGAPHVWFFMNMKVLPRIMHGVGLLRGVEANIINFHGELDIDEDARCQMDIVLFGFHEPIVTPGSKRQHTEAVIRAMESGKVDVFAHGGNPRFPLNAEEVAQAAVDNNVLIEINNSSFTTSRVGSRNNCAALAEAVGNKGGYLTFGSDAHLADKVGNFDECLALIRSVEFPAERILSCNGTAYLDFLKLRKPHLDMSGFDSLFG